jgi:rRNA maturation RNase YbeY
VIYYRNDVRASGVDARALKSTAVRLLEALDEGTSSLSLTLVDDAAIRTLNHEHRGKDKATDVLSFGLVGEMLIGRAQGGSFARQHRERAMVGGPHEVGGAHSDQDGSMSPRTGRAAAATRGAERLSKSRDLSNPERMLGDVVISVDTARRQAAQYDATLQNELYRLLIHGVLHVLGHDHERATERTRMEAEERRLADAIGMHWPYEVNT